MSLNQDNYQILELVMEICFCYAKYSAVFNPRKKMNKSLYLNRKL